MKILIMNWRDVRHPRAGGADFRLQQVYAPLVRAGHKVVLYSCSFAGASRMDSIDGIRVYRVGNDWTFAGLCLLSLRRWVREHRPDVVVEDLNKLPFYAPWVYKGPLVVQMHHLWRGSIFRETMWPIALLIWLAEESVRWVYRGCVFSVVSPSTKGELVEMGLPEKSIEVIYNGADLEAYHPVADAKRQVLLWVGRIQRYKGPIQACQILELLQGSFPELELVIVGDGPYRSQVEAYAARRGLRVRFTGFIAKREKIAWFQRAAVHVQTSLKEGWGLSVIEANACGCPVVANDTTGLCDSVVDGETGLLYRYDDVADAAAKVRRVLMDESLCEQLMAAGLKRAGEFGWDRNSEEMLALLQRTVEEHADA
jgi:glycosyltransferase involved in cell wall biosynthesis